MVRAALETTKNRTHGRTAHPDDLLVSRVHDSCTEVECVGRFPLPLIGQSVESSLRRLQRFAARRVTSRKDLISDDYELFTNTDQGACKFKPPIVV